MKWGGTTGPTVAVVVCGLLTPACYLSHERWAPGEAPAQSGEVEFVPPPVEVPELPPCEREIRTVEASSLPLDMLFVVDNSQSMIEEQTALSEQFPRMVRVLTSGDLDDDGVADFPRVGDLHLGVVSADMGTMGVDGIPGCQNGLGDDGRLRGRDSPLAGCSARYPSFLAYREGDDAAQVAADFGCIATLGTEGCGFEQPLEAGLKALWPSRDERVRFLGRPDGWGQLGHGDDENAGFMRPEGVLAIVVVTDEEDCSVNNTVLFTPSQYLSDGNPLKDQPINLRCFYNADDLYPVHRYINGLQTLREENPQLVLFAAIAGVPPDLVDEAARAGIDFQDADARDRHYDAILADERMVERIDRSEVEIARQKLVPSCETETGTAYPPRRLVQVAREFGANGVVQSICQSDFGPAMQALFEQLGETLTLAQCIDP